MQTFGPSLPYAPVTADRPRAIYEASLAYNIVQLGDVPVLNKPQAIADYMQDAFDRQSAVETLWVICLNRKNRPISRTMVSHGSATSTIVPVAEFFKIAVLASASALVLSHNHPSGDCSLNQTDVATTRRVHEAAKVFDLEFLDHVICGDRNDDPAGVGHYSFPSAGLVCAAHHPPAAGLLLR